MCWKQALALPIIMMFWLPSTRSESLERYFEYLILQSVTLELMPSINIKVDIRTGQPAWAAALRLMNFLVHRLQIQTIKKSEYWDFDLNMEVRDRVWNEQNLWRVFIIWK